MEADAQEFIDKKRTLMATTMDIGKADRSILLITKIPLRCVLSAAVRNSLVLGACGSFPGAAKARA